jgi:hypothetical protein
MLLALAPSLVAQGVVPPFQIGSTNPLPGIGATALPVTSVQQIHAIHLPSDPPQVFLCGITATGLAPANGGVGGQDLLTGRYDALTDTFTPDNDAAALNTSGTEFGMMIHSSGLYAVFDRLPGPPQLATRPNLNSPWQWVAAISGLPSQSYYDPALADVNGVAHLLHVLGSDIARSPIDLSTGALTGPSVVIVRAAQPGGTANSPTPVTDSRGELIGVSHHDLLASDNDHRMSLDLDPNTPSVLFNDTASWTNNGAFVGGRFLDAEDSPGPYHVLAIDSYWCAGGRAAVGAPMEIRAFVPPSAGTDLFLSFLMVGANFLPSGAAFPGVLGELGLGSVVIGIVMPPHTNANGETSLTLTVPTNPALSGAVIPVQSALLTASAGSLTLGNTAALTIL